MFYFILFFAEKILFLNEGDSYKVENLSGNLLENGERKAILEMICIGQDSTDFTHINISHVGGNNLVYGNEGIFTKTNRLQRLEI